MISEAVFIAGRSATGKSSVGFETHAKLSAAGVSHYLIDGDFLDMAYPPPWEHDLAERSARSKSCHPIGDAVTRGEK